jgi:TRAP-type transport system periplasmic protein
MTTKSSTTRRNFVLGATGAAVAPFFIGRAKAAAPEHVLDLVTVAPADSVWEQILRKYKGVLKTRTEGRVAIKQFLGGAKGSELETVGQVLAGRTAIFAGSMGALASAVPEVEAFELPYLFASAKKARDVLIKLKSDMDGILMDRGFKLLMVSENGFRSMGFGPGGADADPVKGLKNVKMRAMETQCHIDTYKALGASPVPIPITETLQALQTGLVDGYCNSPVFTFAAALHVGTVRWVYTNHIYQPGAVVMSRKVWDKLPADIQKVLDYADEGNAKLEHRGFQMIWAMDPVLKENMVQSGIKVEEIDAAGRKTLAQKTAKVHDQFGARTTKAGKELLKKIKASA